MAIPLEFVVADCVDVAPFGATIVKLTLAPEAGSPPFKTVAAIGTVPGLEKFAPDTIMLAASVGADITVALATSVVLELAVVAVRFTEYVPTGVPPGAPLPSDIEAVCPGASETEEFDKFVAQPEGSVEFRLILLEAQPDESLFVTATL